MTATWSTSVVSAPVARCGSVGPRTGGGARSWRSSAPACSARIGLAGQEVLTGPGGVPASAAGAGTARSAQQVRAEPGDSLWSIAERFHGEVALTRYVDALVDLNGGTAISAGQVVRLP